MAKYVWALLHGETNLIGIKCDVLGMKAIADAYNFDLQMPARIIDGKIVMKQDCVYPAVKKSAKTIDNRGVEKSVSWCECPDGSHVGKNAGCSNLFGSPPVGPFPPGLFCNYPMVNLSGLPGGCACPPGACGGACKPCQAGHECIGYTDKYGNNTCTEKKAQLSAPFWPELQPYTMPKTQNAKAKCTGQQVSVLGKCVCPTLSCGKGCEKNVAPTDHAYTCINGHFYRTDCPAPLVGNYKGGCTCGEECDGSVCSCPDGFYCSQKHCVPKPWNVKAQCKALGCDGDDCEVQCFHPSTPKTPTTGSAKKCIDTGGSITGLTANGCFGQPQK